MASSEHAQGRRMVLPARITALRSRLRVAMPGLRPLTPVVAVAILLAFFAHVYYLRWGFDHLIWGQRQQPTAVPALLAFNNIGYRWSARIGDTAEAVAPAGYDGQFYYYMARDPGIIAVCAQGRVHCPIDASPLREQRIFYPMAARVLALGNPDWLHATLFLLDALAILITVFIIGLLCIQAGASPWLAAAVGLFCGELLGIVRDLADPFAVMWLVLAVYFLRKNQPLWCAVALAAAALTREQLVIVLPLFLLPWLVQRRRRTTLLVAVVAFIPFIAWQTALYLLYHRIGLTASLNTTSGLRFPFRALWEHRADPRFGPIVAFVAIPLLVTLLLALLVAFRLLRQRGPRALLADPIPLIVLLYALLATLTGPLEWEDILSSARLITPIVALTIILAAKALPAPLRGAYAVLLSATALAIFFMPPILY